MEPQEFYIRQATETEARGPFNLEQLHSLADTGTVTPETLYYDALTECWVVIDDNAEMRSAVFPEAKRLKLKGKENLPMLNRASANDTRPPISVGDMLAAAEGRTDDTKDKASVEIESLRAAGIGCWAVIAMLVISAGGETLPAVDALMALDVERLLGFPFVVLGGLDLLLAVLLGLGTVTLYPFVRFRAALGVGLFGIMFYLHGSHLALVSLLVGSAGMYFCTVTVSLLPVIVSGVLGVGGIGYVAYHLLSQ